MSMLRDVLSDLRGRSRRQIVETLSAQVRTALEAVAVVHEATAGGLNATEAREQVGALEKQGDEHRARLVTALSRTLVIPIDREDLFRLSRSIDDVLDNLRDFARELDLFGADGVHASAFGPLLDGLGEALEEFDRAVLALPDDPAGAMQASLQAKKRRNTVRQHYQEALATLLAEEPTSATLKTLELLRRLDTVGRRLGEAADALADGSLKRGL